MADGCLPPPHRILTFSLALSCQIGTLRQHSFPLRAPPALRERDRGMTHPRAHCVASFIVAHPRAPQWLVNTVMGPPPVRTN